MGSVPRKSALKKTTSALAVGATGGSPKLSNGQSSGLPGSNPESPTVAQQPLVTALSLAQLRLRPTNSAAIIGGSTQNSNGMPFGKVSTKMMDEWMNEVGRMSFRGNLTNEEFVHE